MGDTEPQNFLLNSWFFSQNLIGRLVVILSGNILLKIISFFIVAWLGSQILINVLLLRFIIRMNIICLRDVFSLHVLHSSILCIIDLEGVYTYIFTPAWVHFDLLRKPYNGLHVNTEVKPHAAVFSRPTFIPEWNFTPGILVDDFNMYPKNFFTPVKSEFFM